jgi:transcriptional regulator with XRE-family HTH domain
MSFGNNLKKIRQDNQITQEELAKKINTSRSNIANYENDKNMPSIEILNKLSEIFNCSTDYLLGKTDVRNPGQKIDDVLNEAMIGMSKKDYDGLTDTQKKQIRDFAIFVKEQKSKGEN